MRQNRIESDYKKRRKMFLMQQKEKEKEKKTADIYAWNGSSNASVCVLHQYSVYTYGERQTDCRRINAGACDNRGKYDRDKYDREFRNR